MSQNQRLPPQPHFKGNRRHLTLFRAAFNSRDADSWNAWRRSRQARRPDLRGLEVFGGQLQDFDLRGATLEGASLEFANLRSCDLRGVRLRRSKLFGADLSYADLRGAKLRRASLATAILNEADLRGADLRDANLERVVLNGANLRGADLRGAAVTGVSVWSVETNAKTLQSELAVYQYVAGSSDPAAWLGKRPPVTYPHIIVNDIQVAHFMSLIVNNNELTSVFDVATSRTVLLLGRFSRSRKIVLAAMREKLLALGYAPVVFDFSQPRLRDTIETITTLAGLSKFVIADLSQPKSSPLESHAIVPDFAIPFVPLIRKGERPFSMFGDLQRKYYWVLPTVTYRNERDLVRHLERGIVEPAERMLAAIRRERAKPSRVRTIGEVARAAGRAARQARRAARRRTGR